MKCKKTSTAQIAHSLVWATIMLVTAYLSTSDDYVQSTLLFIILGASFSQFLLARAHKKTNSLGDKES